MTKLTFSTTGCWADAKGFGCASLGLPGLCTNEEMKIAEYPVELQGVVLTGSYEEMLAAAKEVTTPVKAAIVVFGNAGGENAFCNRLSMGIPFSPYRMAEKKSSKRK
jgi:hypothetical protein